jgi:succinoglycan biosynthesis protein ExoA
MKCLVVIPCLNEAAHIAGLLGWLGEAADRLDMTVVVADGGSTDGTIDIVRRVANSNPRILLLHNPDRIQSAAVNRAVEAHGAGFDCLIRIDAHGSYPSDYCDCLLAEAEATGADSVVVSMITKGDGILQRAIALAQNSKLGNGGAKHRRRASGHWTDHGHHALIRLAPFRAVGGYDQRFSHNEDAELDHRLRAAGYRIWMTDRTAMVYYPRATLGGLFRQYLAYGRGRAMNIRKHGTMPKLRQILPATVVPLAVGATLAAVYWWAAVPFALWALICFGYGVAMGIGHRNPAAPLAGLSAMVMHFAWSAGFWLQLLDLRRWRRPSP